MTTPHRLAPLFRPLFTTSALLILALLSLPSPVAPEQFEEEIHVLEVQVPVNVVTRDGEPVRGLTVDDFRIYDEGKQQEITGFETFDLEVVTPETHAGAFTELPSAARRHFLLFFDVAFSSPTAILKARLAARELVLNSLHPTDLVGVMTFSLEQGPRLLVTFTPDRAQVARAIDTLGADPLLDPRRKQDPLRFVVDTPEMAQALATGRETIGAFGDLVGMPMEAELLRHLQHISQQYDRMERAYAVSRIQAWSRALGEVAKALDAVPGRKHIIYLSEGFDSRLLVGRDAALERERADEDHLRIIRGEAWRIDSDERFGHTGLQREVFSMLDLFRRADCVIQAVDIGGLRADDSTRDFSRTLGHDSLFYLANETGGELFKDVNRLDEQLDRVLSRSAVTYLLSFQPAELARDGGFRRLRVRVDAPRGSQVSHRSGYFAPRPFAQLDPIERQLMASASIAAAESRRDLEVDLLTAPFRASDTLSYLPVILEIGGAKLLEGHEGDRLDLELYTYVTNEHGQMQDFFAQQVGLDLSRGREPIRRTGVKYYGTLQLPPGDYLVRSLARNASTGRTGLAVRAIQVPRWADEEPALLPPFFVEPSGRWVLVREQRDDPRGSVVYPFVVQGDPFIPAARPPLRGGQRSAVCLMAYNMGGGDISIEMTILDGEGAPVEGGRLFDIERTVTGIEGLDRFAATFDPEGLEPGEYTLQLAATDPATGLTRVSSTPFTVVN